MESDHLEPTTAAPKLLKLYQSLVLLSAGLGLALWISANVPLVLAPELMQLLDANGAGALSYHVAFGVRKYLPAVFLLASLGLFFFTWWGRPLFVVAYVVGFLVTGMGGFSVMPAWEATMFLIVTLVDGGIMALAFVPPLSGKFERGPV